MKHVMPSGRLRGQRHEAGALAVGDPHLRAVEDVLVAVWRGLAADRLRVAAGVGLAQAERRAHLAGGHARKVRLALLVGAEALDEVGRDRVRVQHTRERHPAVRQLFHEPGVCHHVELETAVLLGDPRAEQSERLHLFDHGLGIAVGVLVLGRDRDHVFAHPLAHRRYELVGQFRVGRHDRYPSSDRASATKASRPRRAFGPGKSSSP